jgi:hypothetical protein
MYKTNIGRQHRIYFRPHYKRHRPTLTCKHDEVSGIWNNKPHTKWFQDRKQNRTSTASTSKIRMVDMLELLMPRNRKLWRWEQRLVAFCTCLHENVSIGSIFICNDHDNIVNMFFSFILLGKQTIFVNTSVHSMATNNHKCWMRTRKTASNFERKNIFCARQK